MKYSLRSCGLIGPPLYPEFLDEFVDSLVLVGDAVNRKQVDGTADENQQAVHDFDVKNQGVVDPKIVQNDFLGLAPEILELAPTYHEAEEARQKAYRDHEDKRDDQHFGEKGFAIFTVRCLQRQYKRDA